MARAETLRGGASARSAKARAETLRCARLRGAGGAPMGRPRGRWRCRAGGVRACVAACVAACGVAACGAAACGVAAGTRSGVRDGVRDGVWRGVAWWRARVVACVTACGVAWSRGGVRDGVRGGVRDNVRGGVRDNVRVRACSLGRSRDGVITQRSAASWRRRAVAGVGARGRIVAVDGATCAWVVRTQPGTEWERRVRPRRGGAAPWRASAARSYRGGRGAHLRGMPAR
jgi:hypothetical protein